jgi:TatD DNase family protein
MWIDAHAHLDRYDLVDDRALDAALAEIEGHRILTISNSMDLPSYRRNLEIGETCDLVIPTFGVHPWNAPEYADRLQDIPAAIEQSPMIGEIGLDHHFVQDTAAYTSQRQVFEFFLSVARDQNKIVTVHTKGAEEEVLALLDRYQVPRAIVHWYSGPLDILRELIDRGATFTVGVEVLHSEHIQAVARAIPLGQLLTETDNPGGPMGFTGRPGTPVLVKDVVRGLAEARETTAEAIVQAVQANLLALIRDDPWLADTYIQLERFV